MAERKTDSRPSAREEPHAGLRWASLVCCCVAAAVGVAVGLQTSPAPLEIFPDHTRLRVGEQIRYSIFQHEHEPLSEAGGYSLVPRIRQSFGSSTSGGSRQFHPAERTCSCAVTLESEG